MKRGAPDHPKMRRLARRLGLPHMAAVGCMEMLWHWAARYAQDGAVGRYCDDDIADALHWTDPAERLITALVESGFVDRDETHRLVLHGWSEHCEDAVHMSLARARLRFADGSAPNLSRLGGDEKENAEAFYKVTKRKSVRTACAQKRTKTHAVRTALASASASYPDSSLPPVEKRGEECEPAASIAGEASVPADAGPTPPQRVEPEPPEPPPRPIAVVATSGAAPARPPRAKPQPRDGGSDLLADAAFLASLAANNPLGVPVTPEEARAWLAQKLPIMRERRVSKYRLAAVNWWSRLRREELDAARRYARNAALAPLAEAMRDAPPLTLATVDSFDWLKGGTL